jgi:hypothetical protein
MKTLLRAWLICVASLRVLSVVLGYLQPATLTKSVFALAADQVTPLTARTFGIWTLLSAVVTLMCALNIESGPLYRTTMASFAVALLYFLLEVGVYHTVDVRSAMPPFVIASKLREGSVFHILILLLTHIGIPNSVLTALSVLLLAAGYSSIVVDWCLVFSHAFPYSPQHSLFPSHSAVGPIAGGGLFIHCGS